MKQKWKGALLILLVGMNLLFSAYLYRAFGRGFYSPHGDGVSRTFLSYGIATGWDIPPESIFRYWKIEGVFPHKVWPPFQFYFNALIYTLSGDLLLTPFLSGCIFSSGIILFLYLLIQELAPGKNLLPLAGVLFYITFPGFKMIDLSGLDQTMFNFFIIGGLFSWVRYRFSSRPIGYVYLSALFFLIATMIRFEGWFCVVLFELSVIGEFLFYLRRERRLYLLGASLIALLFIIVWLLYQQSAYGEFYFLHYHRAQALLGADKLYGHASLAFKIGFYPILLFRTAPVFIVVMVLSLLGWKRWGRPVREYGGFVLGELLLLIGTVVYAGVSHGPWRIVLTNLLLLIPAAIVGMDCSLRLFFKERSSAMMTGAAFIFIAGLQFTRLSSGLPNTTSPEVSEVGILMHRSAAEGVIGPEERIFVELTAKQAWGIWDTQRLSLFAPGNAVTFTLAGIPPGKGGKILADRNIRMAVVWSDDARRLLAPYCHPVLETDHYTVYIRNRNREIVADDAT